MWLAWASRAGNPKSLQYFLSISISNEPTLQAILRAINSQKLEAWPGRFYSTLSGADVEIAEALLGTTAQLTV